MKGIITQLRIVFSEMLLSWAMSVAPKNHPDSVELVKMVHDYLKKTSTARP